MLVLPRNLAGVVACAAKDHSRYSMASVHVQGTQDGNYRVEATDGRVALVVRGPCQWAEDDGSFERFDDAREDFLIQRTAWDQAFKTPGQAALLLQGTDDDFVLGRGTGLIADVQLEGRYPHIPDVFPRRKPAVSLVLNAKFLVNLVRAMLPYLDDRHHLGLHVWDAKTVVGLSGRNLEGQCVDALIMPMT